MKKIRVLIVDDSVLMREAIKSILESNELFEIVGLAINGREAVDKAALLKPDVITMDLKMPLLSGLEAIEEIMETNPIPIIVVSSMDREVIIKTLALGAMDFVAVTQEIDKLSDELVEKVKIAARVRPLRRMKLEKAEVIKTTNKNCGRKIIGIGVSTGGPQALQEILSRLPGNFCAGIVIVQHMSPGFIEGLAEWLSNCSQLKVQVARAGDLVKKSTVFLAPDNYNLSVDEEGRIILSEDVKKTMLHVPAIDVMLKSLAESFRADAVGLLLTGMGSDGVAGMQAIKKSGGLTIAQDEKSSVIFGMNKAAIDTGCIQRVENLSNIAQVLCEIAGGS